MIGWWKQRKEKKKYLKTKSKFTKLPKNFAQKIIELEIQCEKDDCSKEDIDELMNLFTRAIEYYNLKADVEN